MYKLVIETNHDQHLSRSQLSELMQHGLSGLMIRATQGGKIDSMLYETVETAQSLGLPFGLVDQPDPINLRGMNDQILAFSMLVQSIVPVCTFVEISRYWLDPVEYYTREVMHRRVHVRTLSSEALNHFYFNYLNKAKGTMDVILMPFGARSSRWFIDGYCRQIASAIHSDMAYYWNDAPLGWENFFAWSPLSWDVWERFLFAYEPPKEDYPNGIHKWDLWTIGDIPLQRFPRMSLTLVTEAAYAVLFKGQEEAAREAISVPTKLATVALRSKKKSVAVMSEHI